MFYDVVFFKPKEVTVRLLPDGTYNVIKPLGLTIQAINGKPPVDQSAELLALTMQITQLQNDLAACLAGNPQKPTIANLTATPSSLPVGGGTVAIDATVTDADSLTLDGAPVTLPATVIV